MLRRLIFVAFTTLGYNQLPQPITNSAVFATHNQIQHNPFLCKSTNGTPNYECSLPNSALQQPYQAGQHFDLWPDVGCSGPCSVNIDGRGIVSIKVKTPSGYVDPGGTAKQPRGGMMGGIWFDGTVFQVY